MYKSKLRPQNKTPKSIEELLIDELQQSNKNGENSHIIRDLKKMKDGHLWYQMVEEKKKIKKKHCSTCTCMVSQRVHREGLESEPAHGHEVEENVSFFLFLYSHRQFFCSQAKKVP